MKDWNLLWGNSSRLRGVSNYLRQETNEEEIHEHARDSEDARREGSISGFGAPIASRVFHILRLRECFARSFVCRPN